MIRRPPRSPLFPSTPLSRSSAVFSWDWPQVRGNSLGITVAGLTVGDVQHSRWIALRVGVAPGDKFFGSLVQGRVHRSTAIGAGLEPHGELDARFDDAAEIGRASCRERV